MSAVVRYQNFVTLTHIFKCVFVVMLLWFFAQVKLVGWFSFPKGDVHLRQMTISSANFSVDLKRRSFAVHQSDVPVRLLSFTASPIVYTHDQDGQVGYFLPFLP